VPDEWAEKQVKCPRCKSAIGVPKESAVPRVRSAAQSVSNMTTVPDQILGPEPIAPGPEPIAPGAEPIAPGAEPIASGAEPIAPGAEPIASGAEPIASGAESVTPRIEPELSGIDSVTLGSDQETSWSDSETEGAEQAAVEDEGISQEEYQPEPEPKMELELEQQFVNETKAEPKMEPELDPQFVTEDEAEPSVKAVSSPQSIGEDFWSEDLLAAMESGQTVEQDVKEEKVKCPRCGTLIADGKTCQMCGFSLSASIPATAVSGKGAAKLATSAIKFPLIIASGLGGAILGAAIWAGIVKFTGFELGIVAWGMGGLVGFCVTLFTKHRSVLLGILAVAFAIVGILMGKFFIAQWYVMPEMKNMLNMQNNPPEDVIKDFVSDPESMLTIACLHLAEQGEFDEEFAWTLVAAHNNEADAPPELKEKIQAGLQKATQLRDSWTAKEKEQHVREHFGKFARRINELVDSEFGFAAAFIATFGLIDILWVILAIGSAFKIAAGRMNN